MKFKLSISPKPKHTDSITTVVWVSTNSSSSPGGTLASSSSSSALQPSSTGTSGSSSSVTNNNHPSVSVACNTLLSASDDGSIGNWTIDGEWNGQLINNVDYGGITDMHPCPPSYDTLAVACSDGNYRLLNRFGKEEKCIEVNAQGAATTCIRWSHDGQALVTGAEDGSVKVWSRSGMLRTSLPMAPRAIYNVGWSPDGNSIFYTSGKDITIVNLQADTANTPNASVKSSSSSVASRTLTWKGHDGVILSAHWSPVTGRIVTGGEDCRYRIWNNFGQQIFMSAPLEHVITSVAWSPCGNYFAVGSFNLLRLCHSSGWSYGRDRLSNTGSVQSLAWNNDGTIVAGGTGSGQVLFASILEKRSIFGSAEAVLLDSNRIRITDASIDGAGDKEELDFRDRVVDFRLGYGYLVASTSTQLHIFSSNAWHAPHNIDIRAPVTLIIMASRIFLTVDNVTGINIYNYEGRLICNPKLGGLRVDLLSRLHLTLANDVFAIVDRTDGRTVRCYDTRNGRALGTGNGYTHSSTILAITLSQTLTNNLNDRRIALIDNSHDLYISPVIRFNPLKIATMVDSVVWGDGTTNDIIVAIVDGHLCTWFVPQVYWVDKDIATASRIYGNGIGGGMGMILSNPSSNASPSSNGDLSPSAGNNLKTNISTQSFGPLPMILSLVNGRLTIQRGDGGLIHVSVPGYNYVSLLYEAITNNRWEDAIRCARFVKDIRIWSTLAGLAILNKHLDTAEVALAAYGAIDKLQFILHVKEQPLAEIRNAELALYRHAPDEAETILLQCTPPLIYRAIKLNIRLARWHRVIELGLQHKQYGDIILAYRKRYLTNLHRTETMDGFSKLATSLGGTPSLEWSIIKAKKTELKAKELAIAINAVQTTGTANSSYGNDGGGNMNMIMGGKNSNGMMMNSNRGNNGTVKEGKDEDGFLG